MKHVKLGRAGVQVSRLCLGTMNFGPHTTEPDSYAIMDKALEVGLNFFDTANVYGWKTGEGITEQIIGRWFDQGGGRREKVVLATKVYGEMGKWPNQSKVSALHIRHACDASLKRLKTDYIDLYQMHHVDRNTPWDEVWQAMELLVQQGKVLYIGSSNFAGWHVARANEVAKSRHFLGLVSEQCKYNLMARMPEMDLLPACQHYGVGIIPWSPLAGGLLAGSGRSGGDNPRRNGDWQKGEREKQGPALAKYEALCKKIGQEPGDVAIAWLLTRPAVTAPIVGPRTMEQLDGSLKAEEIELSEETLKELDEIFPGYKTSPEQFAW